MNILSTCNENLELSTDGPLPRKFHQGRILLSVRRISCCFGTEDVIAALSSPYYQNLTHMSIMNHVYVWPDFELFLHTFPMLTHLGLNSTSTWRWPDIYCQSKIAHATERKQLQVCLVLVSSRSRAKMLRKVAEEIMDPRVVIMPVGSNRSKLTNWKAVWEEAERLVVVPL